MSDTQSFFFLHENLAFLIGAAILAGIVVVEIIGLFIGMSHLVHPDADIDFEADLNGNGIPDYLEGHMDIMGWLNPGQVPFMIFLLAFSSVFSLIGYIMQWIVFGFSGWLVPLAINIPVVASLSLPVVRLLTAGIARIMPRDETNAITTESLSGTGGVVNIGPVTANISGVARFTDQFGTDHNVIVFADSDENIAIGEKVVLLGPHREKSYAFSVRRI